MYAKLYLYGGRLTASLCIVLCTCLLLSVLAYGQETPKALIAEKTAPSPLATLYACQTIENATAKNECYDRATNALQTAEKRGEIATLDADALREIQEGVFGYKYSPFSKPGLEYIARTNPLETMTAPVKKVERYLSGYVITLDNNQVWEQFAGSISRVPKGKLSAEIKTTPTGTYKMALYNAKTRVANIRVRRIQ